MTTSSVYPPLFEANGPRAGRVAGSLSLLGHGMMLAVIAFVSPPFRPPETPSDPLSASALSFEVDALQEQTEPLALDNTDEEGGNGAPNGLPPVPVPDPEPQPQVAQVPHEPEQIEPDEPEEPEPDEPFPDEPDEPDSEEPDELVTGDVASDAEVPTADQKETTKATNTLAEVGPSSSSPDPQGGPSGGSGKGFGSGHGDGRGLARPVNLFHTFLESLPKAARFDPSWATLARGEAGFVRFRVTVEDGKLQKLQILQRPGEIVPAHLKRLVTANHQLLMSRRFTLFPALTSGTRVFILKATVARRSADEQSPDSPGIRQMGRLGLPQNNGAYFSYYSGQHVDLLMMQER